MKLRFMQADLAESVNIVMKAVPSRTTMPILECILIDASAAEIHFTANDMELGIETVVKGTIEEKGKIAESKKKVSMKKKISFFLNKKRNINQLNLVKLKKMNQKRMLKMKKVK